LNYFPIRHGLSPTQIGLRRLPNDLSCDKNKIFHLGTDWQECLENKRECRTERLGKYYQNNTLIDHRPVCRFIIKTLCTEHPETFILKSLTPTASLLSCKHTGDQIAFDDGHINLTKSQITSFKDPTDLFDALCMQVAEDLVIQQCGSDYKTDQCAHIHLCHANGWSAEWAIGKSFDAIHARVPNIENIIRDSSKILRSIVESTATLERIGAVNFRTSPNLNRHPEIPDHERHVPFHTQTNPNLFLRFERQCVVGFKSELQFLFTIRTYRTQISPLMPEDKWKAFVKALSQSSDGTNPHKFLESNRSELLSWAGI
jgi:hypothetical protein